MTATVRTLDPATRELMPREVETVARGVTEAWGAAYKLDYQHGYPVLVNEPGMTEVARRAAELVIGPQAVVATARPVMAAEDFAWYLQQVPGCFGSIGVGTPGTTNRGGSHSGAFLLDEAALPVGAAYYVALVTNFTSLRESGMGDGAPADEAPLPLSSTGPQPPTPSPNAGRGEEGDLPSPRVGGLGVRAGLG
jgi:metal-dependent amidase/aminoacylase/carboxypeptidase family protein